MNGPSNALLRISREEAEAWCEEQLQLLEGQIYDYELIDAPGLRLQENNAVTRNRLLKQAGTLEPGLNTGLLVLTLEDDGGREAAHGSVEVRSSKLDYRTDYRKMLDEITRRFTDLLMQISEPSQARFVPDPGRTPKTIIQRLAFLQSIVLSSEFLDARDRILAAPHQSLAQEIVDRYIQQGRFKASFETLSQLVSRQPRREVPSKHPISTLLPSLPQRLRVSSQVSSYDTPENRFVKFVLNSFDHFLYQAEMRLSEPNVETSRIKKGIHYARKFIGDILSHEFFKDVHELTILPLDSPVLQRKSGYREMLQAWLRFNIAARLIWNGSDDIYGIRKRDMAVLYEYWVFFKLLDVVGEVFGLSSRSINTLIERTADGTGLKLKSGSELIIQGTLRKHHMGLDFRLSYNRMFPGLASTSSTYPQPGSWTCAMRPDYTLSLWPSELSDEAAEVEERMIHLHFDAKYRTASLTPYRAVDAIALSGGDALDANRYKTGSSSERTDILRMHAYRDAIRRSEGAYVIYPGTETTLWRAYDEILPSVGAFALSPGNEGEGMGQLRGFLQRVTEHVCDSNTKQERLRRHIFAIQDDS